MQKGVHKEDIKAMIYKRGQSLIGLSLENGLSSSSVQISLLRPCPSANHIIADFLGIPVHRLWPDWYDKNGDRIYRSRAKRATKRRARQCQKA